jgi:2-hydroxy-3-keto-5-methylthiopentenyl-1-phosphate phosphatase
MADYKAEIEKLFREVYEDRGLDRISSFEDYVASMFVNVRTSYEAMSEALELGIERGLTLEEQLEWARNYFRENALPKIE